MLVIALVTFIQKTKIGMAMRAVSKDFETSQLMGIKINNVISATFIIGSFLAAVGSLLYFTNYAAVIPTSGAMPGLKAFVAAVFGGIGSIPGRGNRRVYNRYLRKHNKGPGLDHLLRRLYLRPAHNHTHRQAYRPLR